MSEAHDKLLEKAKRCFKLACEAEAKQREREREDLRFQVPEYQWDDAARAERDGSNGDCGVMDHEFYSANDCGFRVGGGPNHAVQQRQ